MRISQFDYVFIDLDRTLFDTSRFQKWIDAVLAQNHFCAPGDFVSCISDFNTSSDGIHQLYDHEAHIYAVTGKPWRDIRAILRNAHNEYPVDFCFSDVDRFFTRTNSLSDRMQLITYGIEAFQLFKIEMSWCQALKNLPLTTVQEPKRVISSQQFTKGKGVLIDDKFPLQLPENWQHLWITRSSMEDFELPAGTSRVSSLNEINL